MTAITLYSCCIQKFAFTTAILETIILQLQFYMTDECISFTMSNDINKIISNNYKVKNTSPVSTGAVIMVQVSMGQFPL